MKKSACSFFLFMSLTASAIASESQDIACRIARTETLGVGMMTIFINCDLGPLAEEWEKTMTGEKYISVAVLDKSGRALDWDAYLYRQAADRGKILLRINPQDMKGKLPISATTPEGKKLIIR